MSVSVTPFKKWDIERVFYGDPALSTVERFVALQILKSLDDKFRPRRADLHSQALIGSRVHAWRESVNRAVRKLVILGYFRASWVTVQRHTKQGIRGVTRVMCELGPVLRKLVDDSSSEVAAGKPRGVMSHHPSPAPPGSPRSQGDDVVTKSAGSSGVRTTDVAEFRRKTLGQWPRLAGSKPESAERRPSSVPVGELTEQRGGAELASYTELSADQAAARIEKSRKRLAASLDQRSQPRRKLPRSRR